MENHLMMNSIFFVLEPRSTPYSLYFSNIIYNVTYSSNILKLKLLARSIEMNKY